MRTIQDELRQADAVHRVGNTSGATLMSATQEDKKSADNGEYGESMNEALAHMMAETVEDKSSVSDVDLNAAIASRREAREKITFLYLRQEKLQAKMQDAQDKLARAQAGGLKNHDHIVVRLSAEVRETQMKLDKDKNVFIPKMEADNPEVAAELKEERGAQEVAKKILTMLTVDDEGCYTTEGTPPPSSAGVREWFEARMKEVIIAKVVRAPIVGEKAALQSAGGAWAPRLAIPEAMEAYVALLTYQRAIQKVERAKSQEWINGLIKSGYLIPPDEVERQKRGAQWTILDLPEKQKGYCFVWVFSNNNDKTHIEPYASLHPEAKIEYMPDNGTGAKHAIRITAVTAPHVVEDFFKRGTQVFRFDDIYELADRTEELTSIVRTMLKGALRRAQQVRTRDEEMNSIRISDALTVHDLADGKPGTAVVFIRGQVCMQLVSDGENIVAGKMTEHSQKSWLCEAIGQGVPVKTFLARNAAGEFANLELQKMAVENEWSEMQHVPLVVARHGAERISAASNNITHLVMPAGQGGKDGTYIFTATLYGRKDKGLKVELDRQVGYVVRRVGDSVQFLEALSRFSDLRLKASGLELDKSYALVGGLNDYGVLLLRSVYCAVTRTPRTQAPEHLREGFQL